jgi:putative hydrolase of the HAD superfamily
MKLDGALKAILFDIGWTLIYPKPTRKEATEKYLLSLGYTFPAEELEAARRAAMDFYEERRWQPEAAQDIVQFWNAFYKIFIERLGIDDPHLPMAFNKFAKDAIQYHRYADSLPVLRELRRRGYLIGAVSNWSAELPSILENLRLIDHFDTLVISDLVGYHKPEPDIFKYALHSLGVDASAVVHIGDDLEADVEGARQGGIQPIWLDRGATGNNTNRIQSLDELLS